jgi:tellurium resistance protein TerZ
MDINYKGFEMLQNLTKGQQILLEDGCGEGLSKIVMGLGWVALKKKGFFNLFKNQDIDLDASCCLFDENKKPVDVVWFAQLQSLDGSIVHTGDNLTGEGKGDDEQINVDLYNIPSQIKYLVFTVNSFRGHTFNDIANAFCRLVDGNNNQEIARYTLHGGGSNTAMIMSKVYRENEKWKLEAIGKSTTGLVVEDLLPSMIECL